MANPGVEDGVDDVDGEVGEDETDREHDDDSLHDEPVALEDRGGQVAADTGDVEDRLQMSEPPTSAPRLTPATVSSVKLDGRNA